MSNDRTLGGLALLASLGLLIFGWGLVAPFAYEPVGPRAFPLLTAALIGICGLMLVLRPGPDEAPNAPGVNVGIVSISAVLLAYAFFFQPLGFVLSTALMCVAVARIFGATWMQAGLTGVALSVGSFLLFDRLLDVVLPAGLLSGVI
ncbi:tripartite tricarboxylate transporter TctB family protein [Aureimonas frigidaquae]|uniref:Inner membrane protein 2 n=1 Tax=Aureimonas frigidaquae TaxID=424757 RepID=A0A0P0Z1Q4_9HYPH|nr:tripartite tricarboxylate transporter TctB family protein [Aureimonas frigidaquae]BAT27830.1 inner membrane protein 2 [Aureimonas frigidaquae]